MAENGQERTEQPTDRRRREARRKGTVTKSVDLTGALVFLAVLLVLPTVLGQAGTSLAKSINGTFRTLSMDPSMSSMSKVLAAATQPVLPMLALLVFTALAVGVGAQVAQVGFAASPEALTPNFNKINPINGLKRLFSRVAVFDAFKNIAKCVLFAYLAVSSIQSHWVELSMIWSLTPLGSIGLIGSIARTILMRIGIAWLVLAGIDYFFQRKQVENQLKMTKEEIKREMKDAETSPELKMQMARRRQQLKKTRIAQAVKTADVIITNPTHFAVALRYEPEKSFAPVVVAKGVDQLALRIRELAGEAKVPIVENRPLARALYKQCEIGDNVPRELFQAVAEVLAFVYRTVKKAHRAA